MHDPQKSDNEEDLLEFCPTGCQGDCHISCEEGTCKREGCPKDRGVFGCICDDDGK